MKRLLTNKTVRKYAPQIIGVLLLLSIIMFFTKLFLFVTFLAISIAASFIPVIIGTRSIGFEFITFPSLIFLYLYGWWDASVFCVVSLFFWIFITRSMSLNSFLAFGIVPILLAGLIPLKGLGIFALGMILSIVGNLIFTIITIAFGTAPIHRRIIYFGTHVAWSWFLFGTFGEMILKMVM